MRLHFWWIVFMILFFYFGMFASRVFAQEIIFQDDFSQGLGKWQPTRDSGELWQVVNGAAQARIDRRFTITELVPKNEFWQNTAYFEYELDFTPLEGVDRNISFGFEDLRNWYEIHFIETVFNLVRLDDNLVTFNVYHDYAMQNGQTYHIRLRREGRQLQLFINNQKISEDDDWSFTDNTGKIGLKLGTGSVAPASARFDNVVVRRLPVPDGIQLNVSLWKQGDTRWRAQEYDSASKWSDRPMISRWGCALTSMAMIMKYYGMNTLPNGQELNPGTLNDWLKSQVDGYLGQGSVNWQAITRLTRLIHDQLGTPKLEYLRASGSIEVAKTEIGARKPVILEIDGHFLVGDGVTGDNSTLYIKDPAYVYTKFSQHNQPLLSVRKFQPSNTDLSYLLFTHSPDLQVTLKNEQGQVISALEHSTESLSADEEPRERATPLVIDQLPKPNTGKYLVEIRTPTAKPFTLQALTYDQAANVTSHPMQGTTGPQGVSFELNYSKTDPSTIRLKTTLKTLNKESTIRAFR